jgi:hypothetical protein
MNLHRCVHARLAPHHGSDSGGRILPGPSEPVRRVHGLVRKTVSLIDLAGHVHDSYRTPHDGEG